MQFYKLDDPGTNGKPRYLCTRDEAHFEAKEIPKYNWDEVRIELIEIATDKATLAEILSRQTIPELVLRTWRLTPRGGLVEGPNGE
mgnify:CR=1 FL=1